MTSRTIITKSSGALRVSFISSGMGSSDYSVCTRDSAPARVRILWDLDDHESPFVGREIAGEHDAEKAERFRRDYGFQWSDAIEAVRKAVAEQFDDDVREIVRMGIVEYSSRHVEKRAQELGLIPVAA